MKRELTLNIGGQEVTVTAAREGRDIVVERDGESYTVGVVAEKVIGSQIASPTPATPATTAPAPTAKPAPQSAPQSAGGASAGPGAVPSPMTGVVDQVLVQDGATVAEGDKIVILEAMKMYIDVTAHTAGTVSAIAVKTGDSVKEGQPLMTIG